MCIFLCLEFPLLSLLWRDVPYPLKPCSNTTRSLKIFLLSFPSGINSSILSAPSTIILFYYSTNIVFLLESRSFLPSLPSCDILEQTICICFISGLYYSLLQVFQVICWIWLKIWISNWNLCLSLSLFFFFSFLQLYMCLCFQLKRAVGNHWIPVLCLCPLLLLQKAGLWSLRLISHVCPLRSKTAALTDDRIKTMSEVITGIRTIKTYAWEESFINLITRLRR